MAKYKLEYIWLDGYTPCRTCAGKPRSRNLTSFPTLEELPLWGFDGQFHPAGRGAQLRLLAQARGPFSPTAAQERRAGDVRGDDARRQPRIRPTRAPPSWTTRAPGSASSRNTSSTRTAGRWAFRKGGTRRRRARTTRGRLQERGRHRARDRRGAPRACLDAGINHEGINAEVAKGQWEFQIFGKGSKTAADKSGLPGTFCSACAKNMAWTSNSIASRWATPTGMAPACTTTSRLTYCATSAARPTSRR